MNDLKRFHLRTRIKKNGSTSLSIVVQSRGRRLRNDALMRQRRRPGFDRVVGFDRSCAHLALATVGATKRLRGRLAAVAERWAVAGRPAQRLCRYHDQRGRRPMDDPISSDRRPGRCEAKAVRRTLNHPLKRLHADAKELDALGTSTSPDMQQSTRMVHYRITKMLIRLALIVRNLGQPRLESPDYVLFQRMS